MMVFSAEISLFSISESFRQFKFCLSGILEFVGESASLVLPGQREVLGDSWGIFPLIF